MKDSIYDYAKSLGIQIRNAKSNKDQQRKAVHLLNPTFEEIKDAIEQCLEEGLKEIYIYNKSTWINTRRNQLFNY